MCLLLSPLPARLSTSGGMKRGRVETPWGRRQMSGEVNWPQSQSIKKMLLHVHGVAPLQTFANNGMNSPAVGRRLSLFPPDNVMQHLLQLIMILKPTKQTSKLTPRSSTRLTVNLLVVRQPVGLVVNLCQCKTSTLERHGSGLSGRKGEVGEDSGGALGWTCAKRQ